MQSKHFAVALLFLLPACTVRNEPRGDTGPGPAVDGAVDAPTPPGGIRIDPADHVATIAGGPVVVDYRALRRNPDGSETDVTGEATWTATVAALGTFAGARFTSVVDRGGVTGIRARVGTVEAVTSLTLRIDRTIVTSTAPPGAETLFGGTPDPAAAPDLVYPPDGTMVPPNLGELEFHYRTAGSTVFELSIVAPAASLRIYFGCPEMIGGGCAYVPDDEVWTTIATAARGAGPIRYRLRGVDPASGRLGETSERTITVAEEDITGGLYYWNAGGGTINRFEFGVRGARAEVYLDQPRTGAMTCVGCHTLSRNGRRIAVGTDIPGSSFQVFDVATRTRIFALGGGFGGIGQPNFASFDPDAARVVTSGAMGLEIRDATNGMVLATAGMGGASMPDWSPDGQHIVYVRYPPPPSFPGFPAFDPPGVDSGTIEVLDWTGSAWVGRTLVARSGENNYYPAYSPDGEWVVFNRSPSNTNSMGSDSGSGGMSGVRDAQLWVVRADGSTAPTRLTAAGGLTDSWPKFDPTSYRDNGRAVFWFAWSSRRAFGLRYGDDARVQLWMSAFDPSRVEPALPAFRLPFQDIDSGNHIAQWVTSVERRDCATDADCGGEFCYMGRCYEQVPIF